MGMLVEGEWTQRRYSYDADGRFQRRPTTFHHVVEADPGARFPLEPGRYHLYVSLACPWAHRTLIVRKLRGLEDAVSLSVVHWFMGDDGWTFEDGPGVVPDAVNGARFLREVYTRADPKFTGNVTVPLLWDKQAGTAVNNESREIIRMFDTVFDALAKRPGFRPPALVEAIDAMIDANYEPINNGVYRAGFAHSQTAYEEAVDQVFAGLDRCEALLAKQPFLCGDQLTEADWCLFTTLLRFDPVYHTHFKCNLRRVSDYPNLWSYVRALYQIEGVRDTVDLFHIKHHYYESHAALNPRRIVPKGPLLDLEAPHGRRFPVMTKW